ncbi:MAG: radical SAM protein [Prolixibacteraceae bacterium]|nr:radical SAM protein [Prolixibacteraceae bacterium]
MRVLLINPWETGEFPPPSIAYLQSALKDQGVDVAVKDLHDAINDTETYDITGVSFHSFSVRHARLIRDRIKGRLICGGHHPSAMPEQMLSIGYDQVVIGEGENAIIDIVQGNNEKIVSNCEHKYFYGINEIPFPDYTGLKFYGTQGIPIISSRGCPFRCNFCGSTEFWGHKYQMRSADNVILEIEKRKSEGFKTWIFYDDNFTANKKRVFEICAGLDGELKWQCVGRAESMDEELARELYRAGCRKVHFGIESLSQDALDRMGKNTTVEKMLRGVEIAENNGINTMSLFLVGLPGDTYKNIEETKANRLRSRITQYGPNICWVLPNTSIYNKAKEYGMSDSVYLESGAPFYTYEHSYNELLKWSQEL